MKRIILITIILVFIPSLSHAVGQAGLEIAVLKAGVGARPLGMGGAFTAIADNSDSPYWNPAGLSQIKFHELSTMQTKLSTDTDHYYISYVQPLFGGTFGISWIQVGLGDIYETIGTNEANEVIQLGVFSYYSNAFLLAYGQEITKNLSWGITGKYLTSDFAGLASAEGGSAYGYSITPGILYKASKQLSIGLKIDEILNAQQWGTGTEERVPAKARLGIAYRDLFPGITIAGDISQILKENYIPEASIGGEWKTDGLSIRLGHTSDSMTAGCGFEDRHIRIDYAYVNQLVLSKENVHRISLTGKW